MDFKKHIEKYFKEVWQNKLRIILGVLIFMVLVAFTGRNMWGEVTNKQFIIATALCVLTGIFIIFPMPCNRYISIPITLFYFYFVPGKMFVRIEIPVHDLTILQEGAEWANRLIIVLIFAVLLLLLQRVNWALGIGSILILVVSLINFYLNAFRGSCLTFNDLLASKTALTVIDNYKLFMTSELWYSILYFCFFIVLGFWCKVPYKKIYYHIGVSVIALGYILYFGWFWNESGFLKEHGLQGNYWNMAFNERLNGFLLSFGITMDEGSMEKPAEYSERAFEEIVEQTRISSEAAENFETPNIIFIMNEAWSDLRVLGNLETSEPFMPFVDSMTENTLKGNVHVGILGGLTANSEFEVLTGDTLAFLATSAIPYQLQINHSISSIATVLGEQGYQTMSMHPSGAGAWNREKVYHYMGFDTFIDEGEFEAEYTYVRTFLSDECDFNEIIYRFENREKGKPFFLFNVTIQNHGDYYGGLDLPIEVEKIGSTNAEDAGYIYDVQTYLNLIKVTDEAFEQLIDYFSKCQEPTIICMFGDHQPSLSDSFYQTIFEKEQLSEEDVMKKYITPYVIWTNYDSNLEEYGDMSANYLGAVLLDCAGVKLPVYYEYLLQLQKEYPVLSHITCLDAQGQMHTIDDLEEADSINKYRMLQYNHLMEKNWKKELFSVN